MIKKSPIYVGILLNKLFAMVLFLNGTVPKICPQDSQSLYNFHPIYKETAGQFLTKSKKTIGPSGLLYVLQREFAAVVPQDKNVTVIGSDDATTCIIVVVRHSLSGAIALGHFDGSDTYDSILHMIQRIQDLSLGYSKGRIELQLVGGYSDIRHYSEDLFSDIVNAFNGHSSEVDLTLVCVGQLNSETREGITWPIICGIGVDTKTGEIFPASFPVKGPLECLRSARYLGGNLDMLEIYDTTSKLLKIGPFNYIPLRGIDFWLKQNDDIILQHFSTSPEVEPPHFVTELKATLKYMQENPFPAVTIFPNNKPFYFQRDKQSNMWIPLQL